jgi:hypothetical protein
MNTIILFLILAAVVFMLTYDPKSRTLDKYISQDKSVSSDPIFACPPDRYHEAQFGTKAPPGACAGEPPTMLGAII